jgi:hypothetical protein
MPETSARISLRLQVNFRRRALVIARQLRKVTQPQSGNSGKTPYHTMLHNQALAAMVKVWNSIVILNLIGILIAILRQLEELTKAALANTDARWR